jgi:hypothetical protein
MHTYPDCLRQLLHLAADLLLVLQGLITQRSHAALKVGQQLCHFRHLKNSDDSRHDIRPCELLCNLWTASVLNINWTVLGLCRFNFNWTVLETPPLLTNVTPS